MKNLYEISVTMLDGSTLPLSFAYPSSELIKRAYRNMSNGKITDIEFSEMILLNTVQHDNPTELLKDGYLFMSLIVNKVADKLLTGGVVNFPKEPKIFDISVKQK